MIASRKLALVIMIGVTPVFSFADNSCNLNIFKPGAYKAKQVLCAYSSTVPSSSGQNSYPPDEVEIWINPNNQASFQWRFFRQKEGITVEQSANWGQVSFQGGSNNSCTLVQKTFNGLGCIVQGCSQTVGTFAYNPKNGEMSFKVPGGILDLCRDDSNKDATIILAADTNPISDDDLLASATEGVAPPAPNSDQDTKSGSPFINIARYWDGTPEAMSIASAEAYCKNPRFVTQPAHLPTVQEMTEFIVSRGAKGLIPVPQLNPGQAVQFEYAKLLDPQDHGRDIGLHSEGCANCNKVVDDVTGTVHDYNGSYVDYSGYNPIPFPGKFWTASYSYSDSALAKVDRSDVGTYFMTPTDGYISLYYVYGSGRGKSVHLNRGTVGCVAGP